MTIHRLTHAILLSALLTAPGLARAAEDEKVHIGDLRQGARLFDLNCRSCHGDGGNGKGVIQSEPASPALNDPSRMTLLSDKQVFSYIKTGGEKSGRSPVMPAFADSLDDLEIWDIVAYLRDRHLGLPDFYPDAESFFGDTYTIDEWGLERHEALTGVKIKKADNEYTVLGVYKGTQGPDGARLIPDDPLALSKIDRRAKVGYVSFVKGSVPGVKGTFLFGISMDNGGLVWKIRANTDDKAAKAKVEKILSVWEGYGNKGLKDPFEGGRSKQERAVAKAWTEIYSRAMEAVVMYDKAERERHWADSNFGGPADPEASVEGGILEVKDDSTKKKKRK
ncbi:MAG: cytochrome c [Deltaproteobacteria bacterium]|nr:cytochrome c [Deltaproteobacteria bacterium]